VLYLGVAAFVFMAADECLLMADFVDLVWLLAGGCRDSAPCDLQGGRGR
jgi:hypothetical protein